MTSTLTEGRATWRLGVCCSVQISGRSLKGRSSAVEKKQWRLQRVSWSCLGRQLQHQFKIVAPPRTPIPQCLELKHTSLELKHQYLKGHASYEYHQSINHVDARQITVEENPTLHVTDAREAFFPAISWHRFVGWTKNIYGSKLRCRFKTWHSSIMMKKDHPSGWNHQCWWSFVQFFDWSNKAESLVKHQFWLLKKLQKSPISPVLPRRFGTPWVSWWSIGSPQVGGVGITRSVTIGYR